MEPAPTETKERIIAAAARLFYGRGVKAVSVDDIAEKAGVTKRTVYYHFRSKDDLIAAYLDRRDQPNLTLFQRWYAEADGSVAIRIQSIFDNLAKTARSTKWKGCGFLRTVAELADMPGHPAAKAAAAHKKRVEGWLSAAIEAELPAANARQLAQQVMLLMDGAFSAALTHRDATYMETAGKAANALLTVALSAKARA